VFTDEYTLAFGQAVYFVSFALIFSPRPAGFGGRGVGVPGFSSPFGRFSFAPAPSTFALLKTILHQGKLILRKQLSASVKAGSTVRPAARPSLARGS
jgi:hypothetical protein